MKLTPAMKQYMDIKQDYPDGILLFRMGDFYECFYDDAKAASEILGITLTSRGKNENRAPLAGLPYHALEKYLKGLVDAGRKVVIVEQMEDPKKAKGVVKRGVARVVTPGTVIEDSILSDKSNNFIASVFIDGTQCGLALCDISTGIFEVSEYDTIEELLKELGRVSPSEIVIGADLPDIFTFAREHEVYVARTHEFYFWFNKASVLVTDHFAEDLYAKSGLQNMDLAVCASGGLLMYLRESQKLSLDSIKQVHKHDVRSFMMLDEQTIRNLELFETIAQKRKEGSVLSVIDHTKTSMGARMLKQWMIRPLLDVKAIAARHQAVLCFVEDQELKEHVGESLQQICDIERLVSRLNYDHAHARDLVQLKDSLTQVGKMQLDITRYSQIGALVQFTDVSEVISKIDATLKDECPLTIREGNFIKRGFNADLDELWEIKNNSREVLARIEKKEIESTGISTLKIKYNRIFGYFLEVTKRYKEQVPSHYQSKQSTVNSERYVTDELKEIEVKILSAQDKIQAIEYDLFVRLTSQIKQYTEQLRNVAKAISTLDCLCGFGIVSAKRRYVLPDITEGYESHILESRHPVVEVLESQFVSNDCSFTTDCKMMMITGPNMAGKSTYMRQVAIAYLLAQIGCFVPAKEAKIGVVDQIFTRVGSRDNLAQGRSTFMVEMEEVANILKYATDKSLLVLDEIGSGTSTYDGVAIAWAVGEDIAKRIGAKTLFSTHYHVLTKLGELPGVQNFNVSVHEKNGKITFLRKILKGGTDKSYGIHVAALAGVRQSVIDRAIEVQVKIEEDDDLHGKIVVEKRASDKPEAVEFAKLTQKRLFDE